MANHVPRQEQLDDQKILEETETTKDISLMKELTKLYQQRIEDLNSLNQDGSSNELKIQVLETAIRDLGDLNVMLVDTVNQLEREAVKHVKIFERHLLKSSSAAERYMSQIETINSVAKETARDLRRSKEEELKELPQCESQDLQVSLLTRQLQHCEDHISAQEELIKHLEEQLKKSKEEYEKVLTSTNSKRRLSLDDSLRCSEDEIEDLEKSFIDEQVEMSESLQQFQKLSHQNNESWNFRETGTELHHNITEEKRDLVSQIEHAKEMEQKYNDLLGEKQKLLIELEKLKLNETDDEFKISKDESWRLSSEVTSLKNQLIMVKDSLSNKEKIISNMDETIRVLRDSFNVQTQEVTNLHFKIGIMGAENQEYEKQIKVMEDEMSNLRHQLEKEKEEKSRVLNDLSQNKKEMENQQIVMDSLKQALMTTKQQLENLEGKGFDVNSSIGEEDRQSQLNTIEYWRKYCSCLFEIVKQQSVLFNIKCDLTDAHTCVSSVEPQTPYLPNSTKKISTADATLVHERMCELEALRVQIEDQTHVIQQLQWDSTKIKESHLSLTKMYQDRCTNLNMLKDKHKHLKKKCEEFEKENEMARSKLQNNAESVCALEEKVKFLSNENNLLKSDVTYLQEEITALSNTNIALANDLSLVQKDNKMMLDTLSDKQNTIEALETNEVDIYNKLMEVSSMKNKVEVDLDNLKSLHAIQIEVNRQHEDRNIDLQHQIKQLTEDSLAARKLYEEAKGLEIQHMKVLNKNLHLEKEILNVKNQYEKQALDNNKQIFDLQQELNNSQNTLKDMTQRIEQLHLHKKEKESEIQQMEMKIGDVLSMESEIQHLSQRIQKLNSELSVKGSEYVRLVSRNSVLSSKLNDTESKVSTLQQVILDKEDEFSKQLEERHGEEAKLKSTIESLKFEILQLKEELHLESVKFLGVKSKIEELQRELMKKASTEMTLQRSLTTAELTLVREKEKVEIKNSENSRLKYELFHLKSVIAKWEHELPTVFTQGPEHDITTEDFLSLRREMAKLKDEVNRLTAIYDNNNIEVRNYLGNWWWDDFLQMN